MAQAYYLVGDTEEGIEKALAYGREVMGFAGQAHPDIRIERHALFTVESSRHLIDVAALAPVAGKEKLIIVAAERIFHEAQNALLKLFEEPPAGTTLVLVIPGEGALIPTLRSRLQPLQLRNGGFVNPYMRGFTKPPASAAPELIHELAQEFSKGNAAARAKIIAKLLDAAKSDDDEEKQAARAAALRFAEGLARVAYAAWREKGTDERKEFLSDLDRLIPVLNDRSAPLKPVLEHILIIAPRVLL